MTTVSGTLRRAGVAAVLLSVRLLRLSVVVRGRRTLIDGHRISARSGYGLPGSRTSTTTTTTGRFVLGEEPAQLLVVDEVACVEQSAEASGSTRRSSRRRTDAEPLVDVRADLLLDRVRDGVLHPAQDTAEEATARGGRGRFPGRQDDASTGAIELSTSTTTTTVSSIRGATSVASSRCTTSTTTTASVVTVAASVSSVAIAGIVIGRKRRIETAG
uniref:Uncharacterized protein n=1 Tax=Anopheles atroparvus TaxID=41427 RepID=A0A182J503_ANOAO